ncbi:(2Fe-2S)-binding protein [Rhodoferax sp.]|uniref:(2Fe-2S)-binding protein n=1 Tax=Rhodoferax sp. TaxID=50421 RepID=UPI003BB7518A
MPTLNINGENRDVDVAPDTPLLWALRDTLMLTGTKYGCGIAACGACTVLLSERNVIGENRALIKNPSQSVMVMTM